MAAGVLVTDVPVTTPLPDGLTAEIALRCGRCKAVMVGAPHAAASCDGCQRQVLHVALRCPTKGCTGPCCGGHVVFYIGQDMVDQAKALRGH